MGSTIKRRKGSRKKKFYVGNGRVFWGDGVIPKNEINTTNIIEDIESESTELPFKGIHQEIKFITK